MYAPALFISLPRESKTKPSLGGINLSSSVRSRFSPPNTRGEHFSAISTPSHTQREKELARHGESVTAAIHSAIQRDICLNLPTLIIICWILYKIFPLTKTDSFIVIARWFATIDTIWYDTTSAKDRTEKMLMQHKHERPWGGQGGAYAPLGF